MRGHGADRDDIALIADVAEVIQAADVNQGLGGGEAQLHQRKQ